MFEQSNQPVVLKASPVHSELRKTELASKATKLRSYLQRGMTTVEYAVGILAAAAFALVMLRVINDNRFFEFLFDTVINLLKQVMQML